jgi:hypothetical protein
MHLIWIGNLFFREHPVGLLKNLYTPAFPETLRLCVNLMILVQEPRETRSGGPWHTISFYNQITQATRPDVVTTVFNDSSLFYKLLLV